MKRLDNLIVIDVESTCDEPRPQWRGEIIEIGLCLLDLNSFAVHSKTSFLVKPVNTPITPFCTQLTTITPQMIQEKGVSLFEACAKLDNLFDIRNRPWASWGSYDRQQLNRCCDAQRFQFPGANSDHWNLKDILAVEYGWRRAMGLDKALEFFRMNLVGTHHRGDDDAFNIAQIYANHLRRVRRS